MHVAVVYCHHCSVDYESNHVVLSAEKVEMGDY